jgi:hypothetical protein
MSPVSEWLNRTGMLLGFLSFWFAAPEFIGEERLKAWEQALAAGLLRLPKGLQRLQIPLSAAGLIYSLFLLWRFHHTANLWQMNLNHYLLLSGLSLLVGVLLDLSRKFVEPIVSGLATNDRARQTALFFGAVLFTASFLLQFIATFF